MDRTKWTTLALWGVDLKPDRELLLHQKVDRRLVETVFARQRFGEELFMPHTRRIKHPF